MHANNNTNGVYPLRKERERAGLSQVALAARAGCSIGTVSLAERGGFLTKQMAERLAKALGTTPEALLHREPERGAA